MERYLHKFESLDAFGQAYFGNKYKEPWVSYTKKDVSEIKVLLNYSGDPELELSFVEKTMVYNDGDGSELYVWRIDSNPSGIPSDVQEGMYFATDTFEEYHGDGSDEKPGYIVESYDGEWNVTGYYGIWGITVIDGPINKVDYNKMTAERAYELGNYVEVSCNWKGDERYDTQYNNYHRTFLTSLSFGPNFDNTMNSAIVFSGDANENGKFMFTYDGQEFDPNNGCGAFEINDYSYTCSSTYNTEGGYVNIKMHPRLTASGRAYLCIYDPIESRWFANWNGTVG